MTASGTPARGLTEREAAERAAHGRRNVLPPPTGRTYAEIVRENVLTVVNVAILALGIALAYLGEPTDALVSVAVVAVNIAVGVVQEIRAKVVLDRIALLVRPAARVLRDGIEREVAPRDIVLGDRLLVGAGDQVQADGVVVAGGPLEMDESLLTGESRPATRRQGDELLSGTFCVAGSAAIETRRVGEEALANRLTAGARAFRRTTTPLQRRVDTIMRAVLAVAVSLTVVALGAWSVERGGAREVVMMTMVIAGLVPNGLLLAASAAYALGAVRVARQGVLVQQANAIDSLSNVDVLCMDKTGTLTTGEPRVARMQAFGASERELSALAGSFAASAASRDPSLHAIAAACPAARRVPRHEVPFSAARRWSGVELDPEGALVLGAPEALLPHLFAGAGEVAAAADARAADGLRVLLLARSDGMSETRPGRLTALGLVCLAEEMRADARTAIERFVGAGVRVVLITGDHPETLRAVARAVGLDARTVVSGEEVEAMTDDRLREVARATGLFARATPPQKERIVRAIRADGRYAAMAGDGVNDVLALKAANVGIALRGGAPSARAVADVVLLRDEIGALVPAAAEGRRILHGMRDILRIFLTRVLYAALVIASVPIIDRAFPFTPAQNALLTLLTVGVPSLAIAAWAPARAVEPGDLGPGLARIVAPAGWSIALLGFAVYAAVLVAGGSFADAQTALTTACVAGGLLLLVLVTGGGAAEPPPSRRDPRPAALAAVLFAAYLGVLAAPSLRTLFDLTDLGIARILATLAACAVWLVVLRWLLRVRALDAVLGLGRR